MASKFTLKFSETKHSDILKNVSKLPKIAVKYGFLDKGSNVYPDGQTTAQVAVWNEYGTEIDGKERVPERPFFRTSWERNNKRYLALIIAYYRSILDGKVKEAEVFFDLLGAKASNDLKQDITAFSTPPNAPSTIKRKKSSNPLIDTGRMRAAVTWEVFDT